MACSDCVKCMESSESAMKKKAANALLIYGTLGASVFASRSINKNRERCPICDHFMSDHKLPVTMPQPPVSKAATPAPTPSSVSSIPRPIRCDYCKRPNHPTQYSCTGCGAPLPFPTEEGQEQTEKSKSPHDVFFYHERPGFKFAVFANRIETVDEGLSGSIEGIGKHIEALGGSLEGLGKKVGELSGGSRRSKQKTTYLSDVRDVAITQMGAMLQLRLSHGKKESYILGFRTKEAYDVIAAVLKSYRYP